MRDDYRNSFDRHVGRLCAALGRLEIVEARGAWPKSLVDDCRCAGAFRQCGDLDGSGRSGPVAGGIHRPALIESLDRAGRVQPHVEIIFDRSQQQFHFIFIEMVRPRDFIMMDGDVLLRAQLVDQLLYGVG